MRKLHRTIGLFFTPFLAVSAITGLLWAYAPHLYLKPHASQAKTPVPVIDERRSYLPMADVVRSVRSVAPEGRIVSVSLKADGDRLVYVVNMDSKKGQQEVRVDAGSGEARLTERSQAQEFHYWVMRLHRLSFFGTKKELTAVPGAAFLLLLITGFFLLRKKL